MCTLHIVYVSSVPKPVNHLLEAQYHAMSRLEFVGQVLFPNYRQKFGTDRRTGKSTTKHSIHAIESRLHEATMSFSLEWFEAWDAVVKRIPDTQLVVEAAIDATKRSSLQASKAQGSKGLTGYASDRFHPMRHAGTQVVMQGHRVMTERIRHWKGWGSGFEVGAATHVDVASIHYSPYPLPRRNGGMYILRACAPHPTAAPIRARRKRKNYSHCLKDHSHFARPKLTPFCSYGLGA